MIPLGLICILSLVLGFTLLSWIVDYAKKFRLKLKNYPNISVIIPAYNSQKGIKDTIRSIYSSYPRKKVELFVVDDGSRDNTLKILRNLKRKFNFKLIINEVNKGKAISLNETFDKTKNEIVLFVDSDMVLNKNTFNDILIRFQNDQKIGGVSCRYKVYNKKAATILQDLEYNMLSLFLLSFNFYSTISLFGGCIAVKRKAFEMAGKFTINAITEDIDLALKMNKCGWKVQQSPIGVYTYAPENLADWVKQKIRWSSGVIQCFIKYGKTYLKNPVTIFYLTIYAFSIYFSIQTINETFFNNFSNIPLANRLYDKLILSLFTLPYAIMSIYSLREIYKILLILPYTFIYVPMRFILMILGFIKGIYKHIKLKKNERGW